MAVNPRGFVPTRHLSGGQRFETVWRPTRGSNTNQIYPGDPVMLDANGKVQRAIVATAAGRPWLGVVAAVYNGSRRPRTHALPDNTAFVAVSTSAWLQVYEDPDIIWTVNASASISPLHVGKFINIVIGSANTAAGLSGVGLDVADITASSVGHPLKIYRLSPADPLAANGEGTGEANQDLEVIITQHMWRAKLRSYVVEVNA